MRRLTRSTGLIVAALVAAATMLFWIRTYSVSVADLQTLGARLQWWPLPLILLLLTAHVALAAARWARIDEALGSDRQPLHGAFLAGTVALAVGTVLPGFVANVAARGISNRIRGSGTMRGAIGGTIDQLSDLAVVALFIPAALLGMASRSLPVYLVAVASSAAVGYAALGLRLEALTAIRRLPGVQRLGRSADRLFASEVLGPIYLLSLMRFACLSTLTLLIHFATSSATASAAIIAVPLVTVAISLAMLPGGFGVSEWSFSAVFAGVGLSQQQIVPFVLGNRILLTGAAILVMLLTLIHTAVHKSRDLHPRKRAARGLI